MPAGGFSVSPLSPPVGQVHQSPMSCLILRFAVHFNGSHNGASTLEASVLRVDAGLSKSGIVLIFGNMFDKFMSILWLILYVIEKAK